MRETRITSSRQRIRRVQLEPPDPVPLESALEAIHSADLITLGPGSLYTSLIPNMLVKKMIPALRASRAVKVYIQNIMTQPGETEGYSAADHIQALKEHCDGILFPNILLNNRSPSADIVRRYTDENAGRWCWRW